MKPLSFGKYRLLDHIATGGMADIFLASSPEESDIPDRIVIKRIRSEYLDRAEFRAMFIEEARLNRLARHQNVVKVFDSGEMDGVPFLALELVDGLDLREILSHSARLGASLPVGIGVHILCEVAQGLHAAHTVTDDQGSPLRLIHRDVCPHNILVGYDGRVRITDFGIAHPADAAGDTRPGQLTGRSGYLSPEQCDGLAIDHRSDIFSLGIVLYEATVGRRLFKGPSRIVTQQMIKEGQVPRPGSVVEDYPAELERIVLTALARDPGERYQSAGTLAQDLSRFLDEAEDDVDEAVVGQYVRTLAKSAGLQKGRTPRPASSASPAPGSAVPVGAAEDENDENDEDDEPTPPPAGPLKAPPPEPEKEHLSVALPAKRPAEPLPEQKPVSISHAIPVLAPEEADDVFYGLDVQPGQVRGRWRGSVALMIILLGAIVVALLMHYRSEEQMVIWAPSPRPVEPERKRARPLPPVADATLVLRTRPEGADAHLDLMPTRYRTPAEIPIVSGKTHTIFVQHPEHYPYQSRFRVTQSGARHIEEVILRPLEEHVARGTVLVESQPPGVAVYLGEELLGQTPIELSELLAWEEQVLQLSMEGLTPAIHLLTAQAGLEMAIRSDLAPVEVDKERFDLRIESNPDAAVVHINGQRRGLTPFFNRFWRGTHLTVRLEKDGHEPYERDLTLDGGSIHVMALMTPRVRAMGTLSLRSNIACKVYVGSEELGSTPLKLSLPSGEHSIIVEEQRGNGRRASFNILLEPGESLKRRVFFDSEGGYNIE